MKKVFLTVLILYVVSVSVQADLVSQPYIAGEFNGWDPGNTPMADMGGGIWQYTITGLAPGQRQEFKITPGDWSTTAPASNSWYNADDSGQVTITFNANVVSDGWLPAQFRVGVSTEPGTWSLVGDYMDEIGGSDWTNNDPTQAMTLLGNGIYVITQTLPAGNWNLKPTQTGTWDAIGTDGRSVDAWNYYLELASESEVTVYVDAYAGIMGLGKDNILLNFDFLPHDPDPYDLQEDVIVDGLVLSWEVAQVPNTDPNGDPNVLVVDPNLMSHKLYMTDGTGADPNLYYVDTIAGWDTETLRASYTPSTLLKDATYQWRVDMVMDDSNDIPGIVWEFDTEITTPSVTDPDYQVVDAGGTAIFAVTATSASTPTYQWYKYVDGISDTALVNGGDISGADSNSLSIAHAELADEGGYYCIVNNDSGVPAQSAQGLLGIKRLLAKWDFESSSYQSTVAGSPVSYLYNDPNFAVGSGISGDGMEFDNDANTPDILYTDPDNTAYFDICNKSITVGCWIQSSFAATWGPMVARNGEDGEGWQLRHHGDTLNRACFTTRGVGAPDDGRASNRAVFDGPWHYVVGTYDGSEKKLYIDGIVSRVYNGDDGSIASESEAATGLINATLSPVALGGRVKGSSGDLLFEEYSVSPAILDEVEIYNYALDAATIAQIYADTSGNAVCPAPQQYDLDGDCIINLNEVSLIASEWLIDTSVQPAP